MLTPEQLNTLRVLLQHLQQTHVSELSNISDALLKEIDPSSRARFGVTSNALVSETGRAIVAFGDRLIDDVATAMVRMKPNLTEGERDQILAICNPFLDAKNYSTGVSRFKSAMERRLQSYGLAFEEEQFRFDLIEGLYTVGASNLTSRIKSRLKNRLDLTVYAERPLEQLRSASVVPAVTTIVESQHTLDWQPKRSTVVRIANSVAIVAAVIWWIRKGDDEQIIAVIAAIVVALTYEVGGRFFGQSHDRTLYRKFLNDFPSNGRSAKFLKEHDMGNPFHADELSGFEGFVTTWQNAEHEFDDEYLGSYLRDLIQKSNAFYIDYCTYIFVGSGNMRTMDLRDWEDRPEVIQAQKRMNQLGTEIYQAHQALVRQGRKLL